MIFSESGCHHPLSIVLTSNQNLIVFHHHVLGCNNGGGGGNFSEVKQLVRKPIGTQKRLSFGGFKFFAYPSQILETQELFPRTYFAH